MDGKSAWEAIRWAMDACGMEIFASVEFEFVRDMFRPGFDFGFEPKSVVVAAVPYFVDKGEGNIALYARGRDYHTVIPSRLKKAFELSGLSGKYSAFSDISPADEVRLASVAEIGGVGRHGMLITPRFGSFVFIGELVCECEILPGRSDGAKVPPAFLSQGGEYAGCKGCDTCLLACPAGIISGDGDDRTRCLSRITQKSGELSCEEARMMKELGTVWGCDACLLACPAGKMAGVTTIPEFTEDRISRLCTANLEGLSNREFREKFGDRAFAYKGKRVLERNLRLVEGD